MTQGDVKEGYKELSYKIYYETYFQELASWEKIDVVTAFLSAVTTSGSAVAGWALWNEAKGRMVWIMIAGSASIMSIVHSVLKVSTKIKEQEKLRRLFCELRIVGRLGSDLDYGIHLK